MSARDHRWGHLTAVQAACILALIVVVHLVVGEPFDETNALTFAASVFLYRLIVPPLSEWIAKRRRGRDLRERRWR